MSATKNEMTALRWPRIAWSVALCLAAFALTAPSMYIEDGPDLVTLAVLALAPAWIAGRGRFFRVAGLAALASPFMALAAFRFEFVSAVALAAAVLGITWIRSASPRRRSAAAVALLIAASGLYLEYRTDDWALTWHVAWLVAARWATPLVARGAAALRPALRAIVGACAVGIGGACAVVTTLWIDGYGQLMQARSVVNDAVGRVLVVNLPSRLCMTFGSGPFVICGPEYRWSRRMDSVREWERRLDGVLFDFGSMAAPGHLNGMSAEYVGMPEPIEQVRARLVEYDAIVVVTKHGGRFDARWVGRVQPASTPTVDGGPITFTPPGRPDGARVIVLSSAACRSDAWSVRLTLDMQIEGAEMPAAALFRHALDRGRQRYGSDAGPLGGLASLQDLAGRRVLDVGYVPLDANSEAPIDAVQFGFYDPTNGERWAAQGPGGATYEANAVRIPVHGVCAPTEQAAQSAEERR